MARTGPKPVPTSLKVLKGRGNGQDTAGRPIAKPPAFDRGVPDCPDYFDADARDLWDRVAPGLDRLELLKPEDWQVFVAYCETWSEYRRARALVDKQGLVVKHPKTGMPHKNPAQGIVEATRMQCLRFAVEFGLTPSSEASLSRGAVLTSDDDDHFGAISSSA